MGQIDALKEEKKKFLDEKNRLIALNEQLSKEKKVFGVKLTKANEQLQYLKKKMGKRDNEDDTNDGDATKENQSPNENVPDDGNE